MSTAKNNYLVRKQSEAFKADLGCDTDETETIFRISGITSLRIDAQLTGNDLEDYLHHAVSKMPGDLRSHVQRINHYLDRADAMGLQGAILDLFLVLGGKGQALRRRVLASSRTILAQEQYAYFAANLESGIGQTDALPLSRESVLSKGNVGLRLVKKCDADRVHLQDPLQEAHDHIEYGQVDEAIQVLEGALVAEPARKDIHLELLDIYRATNASERFFTMRKQLQVNPVEKAWQECGAFFGEEA